MNETTLSIPEILHRHGYEVIKSLGNKYFPSCLLVYHQNFNDNFVCKIVTKKVNYEKEFHALSVLDHPNIVRLYAHFEENNNYFLILEFCEGGSLETLIKQRTRPLQDKIITYAKQIVSALKYMHSQKIAHHDLKPANILFDRYGRIKVADFGLACQYPGETSNFVVGSYGYLAPEQRANQTFNPFIADIWSLGVTIYFMTCGFNPFLQQKNGYKFLIPMFVDRAIADVITGTLEINPAKRLSLDEIQAIFISKPRIAIPSNSWYNIPVSEPIPSNQLSPQMKRRRSTTINL